MKGGHLLFLGLRILGFLALAVSLYFIAASLAAHRGNALFYLKYGALAVFGLGMLLLGSLKLQRRTVVALACLLGMTGFDAGTSLYDTEVLSDLLLLWCLVIPGVIFLLVTIAWQERRRNRVESVNQ